MTATAIPDLAEINKLANELGFTIIQETYMSHWCIRGKMTDDLLDCRDDLISVHKFLINPSWAAWG